MNLKHMKTQLVDDEVLDKWYEHHKTKPFFGYLKQFMKSSPIVAMLWEGLEAVEAVRKLCGVTKGREAEAGSIRGDYSMSQQLNLIHASDTVKSAQRERELVFKEEEIFDYKHKGHHLIYSREEVE